MSDSQDVTDESSLATALGSAAFPAVRLAGEAGSDPKEGHQNQIWDTEVKDENTWPKIGRRGLAHSFTSIQAIIIKGS